MIRRRRKPRKGRIRDRSFLDWVHTLPSIVPTHDRKCRGCRVTAHHVKEGPGWPKNDRRTVPLFECRHMYGFGDETVEHGRAGFEARFGVYLEIIISQLNSEYLEASAA